MQLRCATGHPPRVASAPPVKPPFQQALPPDAWWCCSCRTSQGYGQQSEVFCAANEALRAVPGTWPLQVVQGGEICADACHALAKRVEASTCFTNFPTFALRQRCLALPDASQKSAAWLVRIKVRSAQPLPCVDFVGPLSQFEHEPRVLVDARFFAVYKQASIQASNSAGNLFLKINNLRKTK